MWVGTATSTYNLDYAAYLPIPPASPYYLPSDMPQTASLALASHRKNLFHRFPDSIYRPAITLALR